MLQLDALTPQHRRKCLGALRAICGQHALLPKSVQISPDYNRFDDPQFRGGHADVWKGKHQDREVAVKVLRKYQLTKLDKFASVCHSPNPSSNVNRGADCSHSEILQGSPDVEKPRPQECAPIVRCDNE